MSKYSELLKDPRWQKVRLKVLNRDDFRCQDCLEDTDTLHVHHNYYEKGKLPWEYDIKSLKTLCCYCHEMEHVRKEEALKNLEILTNKYMISWEVEQLCCFLEPSFAYIYKNKLNEFLRGAGQKE